MNFELLAQTHEGCSGMDQARDKPAASDVENSVLPKTGHEPTELDTVFDLHLATKLGRGAALICYDSCLVRDHTPRDSPEANATIIPESYHAVPIRHQLKPH